LGHFELDLDKLRSSVTTTLLQNDEKFAVAEYTPQMGPLLRQKYYLRPRMCGEDYVRYHLPRGYVSCQRTIPGILVVRRGVLQLTIKDDQTVY